jgi:hypothetical protein
MKRVRLFVFLVFAGLLVFTFAQIKGPVKTGDEKNVPTEATHPGLIPVANPLPKMSLPPETDRAKPNNQVYQVTAGIGCPAGDPNGVGLKEGQDLDITAALDPTSNGHRINSDLVSDWRGRLYVATQNYWISTGLYYIQIYRSIDYGKTWTFFSYVQSGTASLTEPSLCIGSGATNGYKLVYAYLVSGTPNKVQVATQDISGDGMLSPVTHAVYCFSNNYARPKVWTEFNLYADWWIMLVAEWQVDTNNTNIHYWRSTDGGTSWPSAWADGDPNHLMLYGNSDSYNWTQPDGVVGRSDKQYVVVYNKTDRTIHEMKIDYSGAPDLTDRSVYTLPTAPAYDVNPGLGANYYFDTQMIVFNNYWASGDDDVDYLWSTDNGATWAGPYGLFTSTSHEYGAKVNANPGSSGQYHVAANKVNDLVYHGRGMASAGLWGLIYTINDAAGTVSGAYWRKGIFPIISSDTPAFTWAKMGSPYTTWFDRLYPDDLVATWNSQGVFYRNTDTATFSLMATPATKITVGDFDGDKTGDLVGIWPGQGGVWVKKSTTGAWTLLSTTADWIAAADMNGDGNEELLGTWTGQGVYWRNNASGVWTQLATPATQIAGADLDHDGKADLIGIWPSQGGVWAKYSGSGNWVQLGTTPTWIAAGDMNGDGYDELLGSWAGQGVFWRNSTNGTWILLATPATMIGSGDLDGDKKDDLLGVWPSQGGVFVRYSETNNWALLGTTPVWLSSGQMRSGDHPWAAGSLPQPYGDGGQVPTGQSVANEGPGGYAFSPKVDRNLVPSASRFDPRVTAGPGMSGFVYAMAPNTVPGMRSPVRTREERRH